MSTTYDLFMSIFEKGALGIKRAELLASASGRVLEIGSGTGVNLPYYDADRIRHITLTDMKVNPVLFTRIRHTDLQNEIKQMDVESIPFESETFDTIVVTLVFCSVKDVQKGLSELRRVLKADGQILFIEHVLPEVQPLKSLFNIATPAWKRIASGCHLNRDFEASLAHASLEAVDVSSFYNSSFISGRAYKR